MNKIAKGNLSNESVNIHYLRAFQSILLQHRSLINECNNIIFILAGRNKEALIQEIENLNTDCYKHKLSLIAYYKHFESIVNDNKKFHNILFCTNVKDYLGASYSSIMKILITLRENTKLFERFIEAIDSNSSSMDKTILNSLAGDFIFLFFSDFSSSEKNVVTLLRHFKVFISKFIMD